MPGKGLEFACEKERVITDDPEHVLRALNSLDTTEEKLAALCKKYTDLLDQHRGLQSSCKQNQRKLNLMSREKEQLQSEHSKAILAKSKLESLCRELQRHNKMVKDESMARAREEEEKRKEVTNKFQSTINDIQAQMNDHYEKNTKLREENLELANKLKNLIEQYELREQHIEKVFKHKDLEQQLVDAKLAQASLQITEEKERGLQEKQLLLEEATQAQKKVQQLQQQETQLRAQVSLYTEKYEEFQGTLSKSNEVFGSFKSEMDKMTKRIKKLEKETAMWRSRWENSNKALIDMAEEKTRSDKEIGGLNMKVRKLESLCRALQAERNKLTGDGKENSPGQEMASSEEEGVKATPSNLSPTKTPPNTPDQSRASPETVGQSAPNDVHDASPESSSTNQSDTLLQTEVNPSDKSEPGIQPDQLDTVSDDHSDMTSQINQSNESPPVDPPQGVAT